MILQAILETLDGIPEALKECYTEVEGRFVLNATVEDHPTVKGLKSSLVNVREEQRKTKEDLAKFKGMDPIKYAAMSDHERLLEEGKLIAAGEVDKLLALRTQALKDSMTGDLTKAQAKADGLQTQLGKLVVDNAVQILALKHGVKKTAVDDVLRRAREIFKPNEDGVAVAYKDGNVVYSKDGSTPLGIDEWLQALPTEAVHLFEESKGNSAPGPGPAKPSGPVGAINASDQMGFLAHLDDIAKGKKKVNPGK